MLAPLTHHHCYHTHTFKFYFIIFNLLKNNYTSDQNYKLFAINYVVYNFLLVLVTNLLTKCCQLYIILKLNLSSEINL